MNTLDHNDGGNRAGGCWPTLQQQRLLRAALWRGAAALAAWEAWRAEADVERLDPGSHRLLPLLYRNLHRHGVQDPLLKRMKSVYQHTWYKNGLLFHNFAPVLGALHDAGIETLILKGAALTAIYYRDNGLRPMKDIDLLVRPEQAAQALSLLRGSGWTPTAEWWKLGWSTEREPLAAYLRYAHATNLRDAAGREFDFHWHALYGCHRADADDDFWQARVPVRLGQTPTTALSPTHQLLHACAHGAAWNIVPPVRWVADAMTILQCAADEIDWPQLVAQAKARQITLPVKDTLQFLREALDAPVPAETTGQLAQAPTSRRERTTYAVSTRPHAASRRDWLAFHLHLHTKASHAPGLWQQLRGFPKYLQFIWTVERTRQLPLAIFSKILSGNFDQTIPVQRANHQN